MSEAEYLYYIGWFDLLRSVFSPLTIVLLTIPVVLCLVILAVTGGGEFLRTRTPWLIISFVILVTWGGAALIPFMVGGWAGYWVEDSHLHVKAIYHVDIPLDRAEIELVDYEKVRPVYRISGYAGDGIVLGKVKLANGETAIALVDHHDKYAILVRYKEKTIVISHPNIITAYKKLLSLKEGKHG